MLYYGKVIRFGGGIIMLKHLSDSYDPCNGVDKNELAEEIKKNFSELLRKHVSEDDEEKQWIFRNCNNPFLLKQLNGMTVSMLHVLDAIGRLEPVNSILISKDTGIPKGTVSKIIPKLILKEFITKESLPNNKKEFFFHITPLGKELFALHQSLHKRMESEINAFLKGYESQELNFINRILEDFSTLTWTDDNKTEIN